MTPEQHARAKELFLSARTLDEGSRAQFLDRQCDDDEIREEVSSLLAHDDSETILMGDSPTVAETPLSVCRPRDRLLNRLERAATGVLWSLFGAWHRRLMSFLFALALMIGLAIWTHTEMRRATQSLAGSELQTILSADVAALQLWIEEKKKDVRRWSSRDDLRDAVAELVQLADKTASSREELLAAPAQAQLRRLMEKYDRIMGSPERGGVISRAGFVIAGRDQAIGAQLSERGVAALAAVFRDQTLFLPPRPEGMYGVDAEPNLDLPVVYFLAPVKAGGEVIAAAGFGFPADGEFTEILSIARTGQTGETYVFDASGELLSESRFDHQLRERGLLPKQPTVRSIFRIDVRDPGPSVRNEPPTSVEMAAWPLTRLAAEAIAAGRKGVGTKLEGVILEPYRNYRGAEVIGAWKWLSEYSIGVANEVEVAERFSPMRYPMVAEWIRFGLLSVCIAALAIATCWIAALGRNVEEAWKLGQYTLEQKIGEGGMGVVYRARHSLLKRPTAVKLLRPDMVDEEALARFQREVQIASGLTHPNTIEIFDFGKDSEGNFYCVMELLEGRTLDTVVQTEAPLSIERITRVLIQVASSLQEAHEHGLVHRDIKPSNIMLCEQGGIADFVKVLDFGLARDVQSSGESDITGDGFVAGTPAYLAPERITHPALVEQRSDLYSFGAVAYYLLAGRKVHDAESLYEVVGQILERQPTPPSEFTSREIPQTLEDLVMQCLARSPVERPASAGEIIERLRSLHSSDSDVLPARSVRP